MEDQLTRAERRRMNEVYQTRLETPGSLDEGWFSFVTCSYSTKHPETALEWSELVPQTPACQQMFWSLIEDSGYAPDTAAMKVLLKYCV